MAAFTPCHAGYIYTTDRQDLQWRLRESTWLAVCSLVALQIQSACSINSAVVSSHCGRPKMSYILCKSLIS